MSELRLIPTHESVKKASAIAAEPVSAAERELRCFVNTMAGLVGPDTSKWLTDLWLNELACMECIPGSESFNWGSVSLSASAKLAGQVISSQLSRRYF